MYTVRQLTSTVSVSVEVDPVCVCCAKHGVHSVPTLERFPYFINVLSHFLRLLRRTSRDRNVYQPPLK